MMMDHRLFRAKKFLPTALLASVSSRVEPRAMFGEAPSFLISFFTYLTALRTARSVRGMRLHRLFIGLVFFNLIQGGFVSSRVVFSADENPQVSQRYLETQLRGLRGMFVEDPEVIREVLRANAENAHFTPKEIMKIDHEWRQTEGVDLFIVSLITNELADRLKAVQKNQREIVEIMITDQRGLLIAATNKTTDFYQADEAWWQEAFQRNDPHGYAGAMEYDESVLAKATPLYLVIRDAKQSVIGVVKAMWVKNNIFRRDY